ncbi:MAG TPA: glutathionylspermidine synthase family protein [Nocardioidaceae bacterium]|nr:glutathionylspermidine synthase family protein [Nocardioidaceae bacterium]
MWRHSAKPRDGWREIVAQQGLVFPDTDLPDGTTTPYWNEAAWYEVTLVEVERMEAATEELWPMCVEAATKMATDLTDERLGLPSGTLALVRESITRGDPGIYARFDLWFDGDQVKMLELNGDTPTGLVETGVVQWKWLESELPGNDQWNSVHERLVDRWRELDYAGRLPGHAVHFFYAEGDATGEEEMTTHYMQDCAVQGGLLTYAHPISHVGWNPKLGQFLDRDGRPIRAAFKLYPWEAMLAEEFGQVLLQHREAEPVRWVEPAWKVLLSTKALLPVLWELYPDHPLLLPSYRDHPHDLSEWVAKPLWGREGDNIRVHLADGTETVQPGSYGDDDVVYQQWCPLPSFDGNRAVIGSWVVDGQAAGMIVRESDGPITDYFSRVVPHAIGDGLMPDAATQQVWRAERDVQVTAPRWSVP